MPRTKKSKEPIAQVNSETTNDSPPSDAPSTAALAEQSFVEMRPSGSDPESGRGQFRSWVVDEERGYTRLTDETNHRLVLQFTEKPHVDILAALKDAGFQFKPDYYGQKNAWVRQNDFAGRVQAESIEKLLAELSPGVAVPVF